MPDWTQAQLDRVAVMSVKHTGTHFLTQLLSESIGPVRTTHWSALNKDMLSEITISPIRHPDLCYATWYSRNRFGPAFFEEWKVLNYNFVNDRIHPFPIDTENREFYKQQLEEVLGEKLVTEWKPLGSDKRYEPPKMDLSEVYNLEVVQFFYPGLGQ